MPDPSPSTPTVLNSNFLQLGRSGGRPQRTVYPRRLPVNTVIHTALADIEPTTFRLLVRRATSSATDSPRYERMQYFFRDIAFEGYSIAKKHSKVTHSRSPRIACMVQVLTFRRSYLT